MLYYGQSSHFRHHRMPFSLQDSLVSSVLIADLEDGDMYRLQEKGINSPGWCLGHIAVETDAANCHLGNEKLVPDSWYGLFYFVAPPLVVTSSLPSRQMLVDAVDLAFDRLEAAMGSMPEEFWGRPCHSDFLRNELPTEGDWYRHILTTHPAMHAGNIAAWRRVRGLGPASYGKSSSSHITRPPLHPHRTGRGATIKLSSTLRILILRFRSGLFDGSISFPKSIRRRRWKL